VRILREGNHLQVSHDVAEQVEQLADEVLRRLLPPPIPKEEKSF
jgi:hypothetical protein